VSGMMCTVSEQTEMEIQAGNRETGSPRNKNGICDFSDRWTSLQTGVETRLGKLRDAVQNFGPQSQQLLNGQLSQYIRGA